MKTSYAALQFLRTDLSSYFNGRKKLTKFTIDYCDAEGFRDYNVAFVAIEKQLLASEPFN
jgi:hypothetical protein